MNSSSSDIEKYCFLMERVKQRDAIIVSLLNKSFPITDALLSEMVALNFRKTLECVAFGSLVTHREQYNKLKRNIQHVWKAAEILDAVRQVNNKFFPVPAEVKKLEEKNGVGFYHLQPPPLDSTSLTESDFASLYDRCSGLLHEQNPYGSSFDYCSFLRDAVLWRNKITRLLNVHTISLLGGGYHLVMMNAPNEKVHHYVLQPSEHSVMESV